MRIEALLEFPLDRLARGMIEDAAVPQVDFTAPAGEAALVGADSLSWRVFRNPVALLVGGIAAVVLELAEPAVRTGVWEHSSFRERPVERLRRTGMAAMVTVYGARSVAEAMIARVVRAHDGVRGVTPAGEPYRANDPALLRWVQATAAWGFAEAYSSYVRPLDAHEFSRVFAEGDPAARLYGVEEPVRSVGEWEHLLASMSGRLEPSSIVSEYLALMRTAPVLPAALRPIQHLVLRGAVAIVPPWVRQRLGITESLRPTDAMLLRWLGKRAERVDLPSSPPAGALKRLRLPAGYLRRPVSKIASRRR